METVIVQTPTFLTLLGGGAVAPGALEMALERAPILVAADGGAGAALAAGHLPEAVIGDFDSLPSQLRYSLPPERVHHIAEQDSTDFEKALNRVRAPLILGVGFTGKRRDHELAAYHVLLRYAQTLCILLSEEDVICLCPPELTLDLPVGTRVSLFPFGPVTGRSAGLKWPIEGLSFAPGGQSGTSNISDAAQVRLTMEAPKMLLLLPLDCLDALIAGFDGTSTRWPGGLG